MNRLAEIIEDNGGPRAVARDLRVSHSAVIGWRDKGNAPAHAVAALCDLYGCTVEEVAPATAAAARRADVEPARDAAIIAASGAIVNRYEDNGNS